MNDKPSIPMIPEYGPELKQAMQLLALRADGRTGRCRHWKNHGTKGAFGKPRKPVKK